VVSPPVCLLLLAAMLGLNLVLNRPTVSLSLIGWFAWCLLTSIALQDLLSP